MHGASERTLFREIQCAGGKTWAGVRAPARRRSPARKPALVTAAESIDVSVITGTICGSARMRCGAIVVIK